MRPGGVGERRFRTAELPEVRGGDPLPTAGVIMAAKRHAADLCGQQAAARAWPDLGAAKAWIDLIPLVTLAALAELCSTVMLPRLARCVGLDPLDGPDALAELQADPHWAQIAHVVEAAVFACRSGA